MSDMFSMSLRDVLRASASADPTPGGGSVSAIAAAFATSMAAMVCNLTIGKKKYKDVEDEISVIRNKALSMLNRLEELVNDDIAAFNRFMECFKMPKDTPEEKEIRTVMMQDALKTATRVPMDIAKECLVLLNLVNRISVIGNAMAISDAGVAAHLGHAALKASLLNVEINIGLIKDKLFVEEVSQEKEGLLRQADTIAVQCLSTVSSRINA